MGRSSGLFVPGQFGRAKIVGRLDACSSLRFNEGNALVTIIRAVEINSTTLGQ